MLIKPLKNKKRHIQNPLGVKSGVGLVGVVVGGGEGEAGGSSKRGSTPLITSSLSNSPSASVSEKSDSVLGGGGVGDKSFLNKLGKEILRYAYTYIYIHISISKTSRNVCVHTRAHTRAHTHAHTRTYLHARYDDVNAPAFLFP